MAKQIACEGCLSIVDANFKECPYCGRAFINKNPAGTLPAYTLLANRYTIGECVAIDGEGVTYKAVDNTKAHRVFIKEYVPVTICASRKQDGSVIPQSGREVLFKTTRMDFIDLNQSLVRLGHTEGLVPVLDVIEANATAYAVREPDEGENFLAYLERRKEPLTQEEALLLLRPVVYGVEAMHRMGLLHRGISPETLFVTAKGAQLSGYATQGLRTVGGELRSQLSDGYAAPEQYSVAEFDGKYTDIYSLGALFYRAMTGHTPLPANLRQMNDTMPPAHVANRETPGYVSAAIGRAMRMAPDERMQSVSDLLAELTTPAQQDTKFHLTPKQIKIAAIAAAGLVLVIALAVWALSSSLNAREATSSSLSESVSATDSASSNSVLEQLAVPSFVGKKYSEIVGSNDARNFLFTTEYEFNNSYAAGEVIRQTPSAGVIVAPGASITLVISEGEQTDEVPILIGLSLGDAKAALTERGIKFIIAYQDNPNGTYPYNCVISSEPSAGATVKLEEDVVVLNIAKEAPASSKPEESSSQQELPSLPESNPDSQESSSEESQEPPPEQQPDASTA